MKQDRRDTEERLRFIAETVDDAISVRDANGTILYRNSAYIALFGNSEHDLNIGPFGHICDEDRDNVRIVFDQVIKSGQPADVTYRATLSDGRIHELHSRGAPFVNEATTITEVVIVTRDLTPEREIRAEQFRAKAELEKRVSEISALNDLATQLYRCNSLNDIRIVLANGTSNLFEPGSGAIYLFSTDENQFIEFLTWGDLKDRDRTKAFSKDQCWSISNETGLYLQSNPDPTNALICGHVGGMDRPYVCIHRRGRGEIDLLLHLEISLHEESSLNTDEIRRLNRAQQEIAAAVARYAALAIENLSQKDQLRKAAELDELTSLFNKTYLRTTLRREILRTARGNTILGVIMADVDHFKKINDEHSHLCGDYVLREVGHFLRNHIRQTDVAFRYGGEEFLLLLPETTYNGLLERAESLLAGIRGLSLKYHGKDIKVTISLGVAMMAGRASPAPPNAITLDDMVHFEASGKVEEIIGAADEALYKAKDRGRNQVAFWRAD